MLLPPPPLLLPTLLLPTLLLLPPLLPPPPPLLLLSLYPITDLSKETVPISTDRIEGNQLDNPGKRKNDVC